MEHAFAEHTGEVEVHLMAADLGGLFEEAGRALAELMLGESGTPSGEAEMVTLQASDRETLMFEWLNELVFRSETEKVVFTDFEVDEISDTKLVAEIRGVEPQSIRTAVKAATFHRLEIADTADGCEATVVFDV